MALWPAHTHNIEGFRILRKFPRLLEHYAHFRVPCRCDSSRYHPHLHQHPVWIVSVGESAPQSPFPDNFPHMSRCQENTRTCYLWCFVIWNRDIFWCSGCLGKGPRSSLHKGMPPTAAPPSVTDVDITGAAVWSPRVRLLAGVVAGILGTSFVTFPSSLPGSAWSSVTIGLAITG